MRELAERLVAWGKADGADEIEVSVVEGREFNVDVRRGRIENLVEAGSRVLGLRVIKDKRTAVASSSDLAPGTLRRLVRNAVRRAELAEPDAFSGLAPLDAVDRGRGDPQAPRPRGPRPRSEDHDRARPRDRADRPRRQAHHEFLRRQLLERRRRRLPGELERFLRRVLRDVLRPERRPPGGEDERPGRGLLVFLEAVLPGARLAGVGGEEGRGADGPPAPAAEDRHEERPRRLRADDDLVGHGVPVLLRRRDVRLSEGLVPVRQAREADRELPAQRRRRRPHARRARVPAVRFGRHPLPPDGRRGQGRPAGTSSATSTRPGSSASRRPGTPTAEGSAPTISPWRRGRAHRRRSSARSRKVSCSPGPWATGSTP